MGFSAGPSYKQKSMYLCFAILIFSGCAKVGFSTVDQSSSAVDSGQGAGTDQSPPQVCGAAGMTQVKLLTSSVPNAQAGNYVDYEISLQTCDGQPMSFNNVPILFDIDAIVKSLDITLQYAATDGVSTFNGTLSDIVGSDLFNHTGSNYAHWSTENLKFSSAAKSITLRVYLMGQLFLPLSSSGSQTAATSSFVIPTYLKIGNSLTVSQDVTFTP